MFSMPQHPAVILVVDKDPLTLLGIAATLENVGYECHCAQDADAATKAVRDLALDLIICDVGVAGNRGMELCRELRRQPGKDEVPVLFISDAPVSDIAQRKQDMGGSYYLRKPIDPDVLMELAAKALWMPHLVRVRATESARAAESAKSGRFATHTTHTFPPIHWHEEAAIAPRGSMNRD